MVVNNAASPWQHTVTCSIRTPVCFSPPVQQVSPSAVAHLPDSM